MYRFHDRGANAFGILGKVVRISGKFGKFNPGDFIIMFVGYRRVTEAVTNHEF